MKIGRCKVLNQETWTTEGEENMLCLGYKISPFINLGKEN